MQQLNLLKLDGFILGLLTPIQNTISLVLPGYIEEELEEDDVREKIVDEVDKSLMATYPQAMMVPPETRRKLIRKTLDMILDDILLANSN